MHYEPVVISLPIADWATSYDFYRRALASRRSATLARTASPSRCSPSSTLVFG